MANKVSKADEKKKEMAKKMSAQDHEDMLSSRMMKRAKYKIVGIKNTRAVLD